MRRVLIGMLTAVLGACGNTTDTAAPVPAPGTSNAPIEIPRSDGRIASDKLGAAFTGDLDAMIDHGVIRVLVAPSGTHFDTDGHVRRGRTVDAAEAFERFVNQRIAPRTIAVKLISTKEAELVSDVIAGRGDIAANVLRTFERDDRVAFAKPVRAGVREIIVTGPGVSPLVTLEDAGGRTIHVRRNSDHHASLVRLNDQLKKIDRPQAKIVFAPAQVTDEELLQQVNDGKIPATIVDDYIYDSRRSTLDKTNVNREVAVSQDGEIGWATRKEATKLLSLLDEFFSTHRLTF